MARGGGKGKKVVGADYRVGESPLKVAVNDWLASLLVVAKSEELDRTWALVLDTPHLITQKALEAIGVCPRRVVVPNPNEGDCESMIKQCPGLLAFPMCSHELLSAMFDSVSTLRDSLSLHSWPKQFGFVWLDYCGTFSSKQGRQRQQDLRMLLEKGWVAPERVSGPSVIAVTFSQRGIPQLYPFDIVDELVLFLSSVGTECGMKVTFAGLVAYESSTNVRKEISRDDGNKRQCAMMVTAAFLVHEKEQKHLPIPTPDSKVDLLFFAGKDWKILGMQMTEPTVLWSSMQHNSNQFAHLVASCERSVGLVFIQDSKLLPVTLALLQTGISPSLIHSNVISSSSEALLAKELARLQEPPLLSIKTETFASCLKDARGAPASAIWLTYSNVFSAVQLQQCSKWSDLLEALSALKRCEKVSFLGLDLKCADSVAIWDHVSVDWIVFGVFQAGVDAGFPAHCMKVSYVSSLRSIHPCVTIIFSLNADTTSQTDSEEVPSPISGLRTWNGWCLNRSKRPSSSSCKYQFISFYLSEYVKHWKCSSVWLHEPGFHFVLPALEATLSHGASLYCDTASDLVVRDHLRWMDLSPKVTLEFSACPPFQAAFLLIDGGWVSWESQWMDSVRLWIQEGKERVGPKLLGILFECSDKKASRALVHRIQQSALQEHYQTYWDQERMLRNGSILFAFVTFAFAPLEMPFLEEWNEWVRIRPNCFHQSLLLPKDLETNTSN